MTLLTIIQDAAIRCGIKRTPSEIPQAFSSTDPDIQQLVGYASDTGVECFERYDWRNLKVKGTITGDGTSTEFQLTGDFQRMAPSDRYPFGSITLSGNPAIHVEGPVNDEWLNEVQNYPGSLAYPVWRLIGGALEVWPALASGNVGSFYYISRNWVLDGDGSTRKARWTADSDTSLINEDTIMKVCVWRYKMSKGLDYAEQFRQYEESLNRNAAQDGPGRVVHMSNRLKTHDALDHYWPGTITP